jgi:hypothetical protein
MTPRANPERPLPPIAARLRLALAVGLFAAAIAGLKALVTGGHPGDIDQVWFALRAAFDGGNPYELIGPGRAFDWPWEFYYPMTAAVALAPLAVFPVTVARILFVSLSSALLAFAVTRDGYHRLPLFLSGGWLLAVVAAQWSPLLTAAACLPALAWVYAAKPNVGFALLASLGTRRAVAVAIGGGLLLLLASLLLVPDWIPRWWRAVGASTVTAIPILTPAGPMLLLALLRWRRPEARLVLLLGCVPMTITGYELLPLFLVPATRPQAALLAIGSSIAVLNNSARWVDDRTIGWLIATAGHMVLVFWPALFMVLARPNTGVVPGWVERLSLRLPGRFRGVAA